MPFGPDAAFSLDVYSGLIDTLITGSEWSSNERRSGFNPRSPKP